MAKESFKNGIQGLRESLENMANNNKFGLKVALGERVMVMWINLGEMLGK